jgi:SAM-dependent methyltransferase
MERIHNTCYPIISQELLDQLVKFVGDLSVLDIGAGTGYLARLLHDRGINVRAIDHRKGPNTRDLWWGRQLYYNVEDVDALTLSEFDADIVLMTWPCMRTTFGEHVAKKLKPKQFLLYQGEPRGGCTGTNEFLILSRIGVSTTLSTSMQLKT